jgi:asparagine synthase (glutamine-hydrolysing)
VLSPESLQKTGFFDPVAIAKWRDRLPRMWHTWKRTSVELGLVAVTATQLWHHLFISGDLAEIPSTARDPMPTNDPGDAGTVVEPACLATSA